METPSEKDKLKEAFSKIKGDISTLGSELSSLKLELLELKFSIKSISKDIQTAIEAIKTPYQPTLTTPAFNPTLPTHNPTLPTHNPTQKNIPTDNLPLYALKSQNTPGSIGNEGVPTDRQTDKPTDRHIIQHINSSLEDSQNSFNYSQVPTLLSAASDLKKTRQVLDSLDDLKRDLRSKFKQLTGQEMKVFSAIYQLEEQGEVDYVLVARKLGLTESSIRDYIHKMIRKGIPLIKERKNNKRILLRISPNLRKITTLDAISNLLEI